MHRFRSTHLEAVALLLAAIVSCTGCQPGSDPIAKSKPQPAPEALRVLTFNVKVDFEEDETCPPWDVRKSLVAEVVKNADADLIGLQETSPNQLKFFQELLPGFDTVGDLSLGAEELEYFHTTFPPLKALDITTFTDVNLMFRRELFEKIGEGHWWLSPTPEKPSSGFGNVFPRVAVWARLKHKPSGREIIAAVTHFDATSPAKHPMAALSHEKLKPFVDEGLPVIFVGDFNTDPGHEAYDTLVPEGWQDAYTVSPKAGPGGRDHNVTTAAWEVRIDHILYRGDALKAVEWQRLESPAKEKALSDHYPVFAVLEWAAQ